MGWLPGVYLLGSVVGSLGGSSSVSLNKPWERVWKMRGALCSRSNVVSALLGDENKLIQAGQGELKVMKMKSFFFFCFSNDCYC